MRKFILSMVFAVLASMCIAGPVKIIKRVESSIPVKIEMVKDSTTNIRIKYTDDRLYDNVKYEVKDGTLVITALSDEVYKVDPSDFRVRVSSPYDIKIIGTGDMEVLYKEKKK